MHCDPILSLPVCAREAIAPQKRGRRAFIRAGVLIRINMLCMYQNSDEVLISLPTFKPIIM